MDTLKYRDTYLKSLKEGMSGSTNSATAPTVTSSSPYYVELNNAYNVGLFAYDIGKAIRSNGGGGGGNSGTTIPEHNHDDLYAKITHNHDGRYYTKTQIDEWRDRLINGDLLFNKITSRHIQAGTIVAGSTIIANGAIGSAQISSLSADKLDAGVVDTSKITISGVNGNLKLRGNRLQVFEGIGSSQFERVSLGDVNDDGTVYGLRVRGSDGNTILYDENGVYREGITDGSINNDKISGDANIDGGKLNIHSVIENINENNTGTIHGTKIDIDGESVTSKVYNIELNQNEHSETIERQQSEINQNKEEIKLKVSNQKYQEDMSSMTSRLDKTESDIEILNEGIALTVSKTELKNQITEVKDFVADEIGELSVGGANYLNNSAPRKAIVDEHITWDRTLNGDHRLVYWQDYNDSVELPEIGYHPHIDLETFHFPCIALINRNATFNMANRELSLRHEIYKADEVIVPDETYVISFDAYSDTELFSFHGGLYHKVVESYDYGYHSGRMDISIERPHLRTWQRYSMSFTTHKGIDISQPMYLVINGHNNPEGSGYIKNIKLERSNIVSQWTPSQFDVDDSLNDVVGSMKDYTNESITELNANISIELDSISNKVSSIESTTNSTSSELTSLTSRVDIAESKLDKDSLTTIIGDHYTTTETVDGIVTSKGYQTETEVQQTVNQLKLNFQESGGYNLLYNGDFKNKTTHWMQDVANGFFWTDGLSCKNGIGVGSNGTLNTSKVLRQNDIKLDPNASAYTLSFWQYTSSSGVDGTTNSFRSIQISILCTDGTWLYYSTGNQTRFNVWEKKFLTITKPEGKSFKQANIAIWNRDTTKLVYYSQVMLEVGFIASEFSPNPNELFDGVTTIDKNGITVLQSNAKSKTTMSADGFAITRTDNGNDIFRVGSNGLLTLNGVFKCYKDGANQTGARLESSGAIMFGYNDIGKDNPVFASGLWTRENMGYFSVGYTRADISDENGCLWISPTEGNTGCRLTYSKLVGSEVKTTNIFFQKDGTLDFTTSMVGTNDVDDAYIYKFDGGVHTKSLKCNSLRTHNIYPRNNSNHNIGTPSLRYSTAYLNNVCTTNENLVLGTVTSSSVWQTYGGLAINSTTGYVFPHKGNGNLSLGTSGNRFHTLYSLNAVNVSSDRRLKTDIHYLDEPIKEIYIINGDTPRVDRNMNITTQDMYDFIKNDLKLASYRYKANIERGDTSVDYNFIAQDILYTKVGSEIVKLEDKKDLDSMLSYNQGNYLSVVVGALQKEIEIRDKQIASLEERLSKLEKLLVNKH